MSAIMRRCIEPNTIMTKERIDKLVVDRGLAPSREKARALIMAGQVVVDDHVAEKAGQTFPVDAEIRLKGEPLPFVSRGGLKLQKALDEFGVDVAGLTVMDVGASTGGFTDCLLQRGAAKVFAVDVGYGQLAWKLREDPRVVNLEKTNIRYLEPATLGAVPDLAVIDASFISLDKVLPAVLRLVKDDGIIIALVKPQFEVGKGGVGGGGVGGGWSGTRRSTGRSSIPWRRGRLPSDSPYAAWWSPPSPAPRGTGNSSCCWQRVRET